MRAGAIGVTCRAGPIAVTGVAFGMRFVAGSGAVVAMGDAVLAAGRGVGLVAAGSAGFDKVGNAAIGSGRLAIRSAGASGATGFAGVAELAPARAGSPSFRSG